MVGRITLRFLGTSSAPNATRNYSSLLLNFDHRAVLVDCGEGTQRQLTARGIGGDVKLGNLQSIFVTHLHQDHVLGLVPLLTTLMGPSTAPPANDKKPSVEIYGPCGLRALIRTTLTLCYTSLTGKYVVHELLWPGQHATPYPGSSSEARADNSEGAHSSRTSPGVLPESADPLLAAITPPPRTIPVLPAHEAELPGQDLRLHEPSVSWPKFATIGGGAGGGQGGGGIVVSAAPILHRCPCIGYVFEEAPSAHPLPPHIVERVDANGPALLEQHGIRHPRSLLGRLQREREPITLPDGFVLEPPLLDIPGRKITVLGDTFDASGGLNLEQHQHLHSESSSSTASSSTSFERGIIPLAMDSDLLVHECTNAALPPHLLPGTSRKLETRDEVRAKALTRGHSTPQVAGAFAGRVRARGLVLNHFSVRYPAPPAGWVAPRTSALAGGNGVKITNPRDGSHDEGGSTGARVSSSSVSTEDLDRPSSSGGALEPSTSAPSPAGAVPPKPSEPERRYLVMRNIEDQATETWLATLPASLAHSLHSRNGGTGGAVRAIAAYDGFEYEVPSHASSTASAREHHGSSSTSSSGAPTGSSRPRGRGRGRGSNGRGRGGGPSERGRVASHAPNPATD